ncbi:hypothetical protein [Sphingobium baderi]|uniref:Uncharacterized protein n=1 Tax=Sphingobium baderi LL03 TaxID=1114964 RepID=T0GA48_9SPHN|nr:hypothetical protein [Sphingobium baderi]EQA96877.1 hypothetical protein L485_22620 [Sphingobium baderi LL03]KMS64116.1 hypothetical protein V475_20180 [Sphingobium baderi LL03]
MDEQWHVAFDSKIVAVQGRLANREEAEKMIASIQALLELLPSRLSTPSSKER